MLIICMIIGFFIGGPVGALIAFLLYLSTVER